MEEIYKALGWQGGTIHQIIDEIKKLKKRDKDIEEFADLMLKEISICEPSVGYKLKDIIDCKCSSCRNISICKFLIEKDIL